MGFCRTQYPAHYLSTVLIHMKTIYSMGKGKYVTLDSYGVSHETRRGSIAVAIFSTIIAAITVSALVGIDITNPSTPNQHVIQSRPGY